MFHIDYGDLFRLQDRHLSWRFFLEL